MQKLLIVLVILMGLSSCEKVEINDIALQANINDRFYKSDDAKATRNADGSITIRGYRADEVLTIHISQEHECLFKIRGGLNFATFMDMGENIYTSERGGSGQVVVSDIDEFNNTISGTFKFSAKAPELDKIHVQKGVFYQVPFVDGEVSDPLDAGDFSAVLNDLAFEPIYVAAASCEAIMVIGMDATSKISINVPTGVAPGTYTLPMSGFKARFRNIDGAEKAKSGEIEILEHDIDEKTIKGNFSFITNENKITEGSFEVVYE